MAGWILVAVVASVLPAIISVSVAGQRGLPALGAFLLGLLGGWFGLVIVAIFYQPHVVGEANWTLPEDPNAGPAVGRGSSKTQSER